ncbi:DUF4846 domain-containing protein [Saprospira grandis]|nr:DUF4846 domain-containing protein [Saprospira grandis]WBM74610.1 DUF4846 domain-containing protein [Saprospira grandis]
MKKPFALLIAGLLFGACQDTPKVEALQQEAAQEKGQQRAVAVVNQAPTKKDSMQFPWLEQAIFAERIEDAMAPPAGYHWQAAKAGSFGAWLARLPLYPEGHKVHLYNGAEKPYQAGAARVIQIDVGQSDLQQCADAIMRLYAEYAYAQKDYERIFFNFTSGDRVGFSDWAKGKKPIVKGNRVYFSAAKGAADYSYANFRSYLKRIFMFAGTASLAAELPKKPLAQLEAGDLFLQGGFPGHAVLVMGVAQNKAGKKQFLLAQSYMPAQEIHLLRNLQAGGSPWFSLAEDEILYTPEWNFPVGSLHSFSGRK